MKRNHVYIAIFVFILWFWTSVATIITFALSYKHKEILCIVGEAENQDYWGMMAVAHAIRNRGNVKGCYGLYSPRVRNHLYSSETYRQAEMAWKDSEVGYDYTGGAKNWCTVAWWSQHKNDKKSWLHRCHLTYTYKDHVFLKED